MLRDRTDLAGRRALLTGAGGGLGRTIAVALAEQGVDLVLTDRPGTDLSGLSRDLGSRGVRVATVDADLTDRAAASDLVRRAEEALGPSTSSSTTPASSSSPRGTIAPPRTSPSRSISTSSRRCCSPTPSCRGWSNGDAATF